MEESKSFLEKTMSIPNKIKKTSDLTNEEIASFKQFEKAGLLTIKDTTITTRSWGKATTHPALDIQLTAKGAQSIIAKKSNADKNEVLLYNYEINEINDMRLICTDKVEAANAKIFTYIVFYTGNVIKASPFATTMGINVEDVYPFIKRDKSYVMTAKVVATYREDDLVNAKASGVGSTIREDEMDKCFDSVWMEAIDNPYRTLYK